MKMLGRSPSLAIQRQMSRAADGSPSARGLLYRVNDPEEAFEYLCDHLTRYHLVPETAQEQKTPGIAKTRK
jgi:hypothetical protein